MPAAKTPATRSAAASRPARPAAKTTSSSSSIASTGTARRVASAALKSEVPIVGAEAAASVAKAPVKKTSSRTTAPTAATPSAAAGKASATSSRTTIKSAAGSAASAHRLSQHASVSKGESSDRSASVLKEISQPTQCSADSVKTVRAILAVSGADRITLRPRHIHFAKQVINATIQVLNELVTSGWRPAAPTSGTSKVTSAAKSKTAVSLNNVKHLLQCFDDALRFLERAASSAESEKWSIKEDELHAIVLSIVRKLINLSLYDVALQQFKMLIVSLGLTVRDAAPFCIALPSEARSVTFLLQALEVQSLVYLAHARCNPPKDLDAHFKELLQDTQGVHAWQSYIRARFSLSADDKKRADRAVYTVEKAVMSLAEGRGDAAHAVLAAKDILACRSASLHLLLLASDVDMDGFWNRTARVGASFIRSNLTDKAQATAKDRLTAFEPVHALFRDLVMRVRQTQSLAEASDTFGEAYKTFCDHWTSMARRAGDGDAIRSIAQQRNGIKDGFGADSVATSISSDIEQPDRVADDAVTILALASVRLADLSGGGRSDELKVLLDAANILKRLSLCWSSLFESKRRACLEAVDTTRRQCSRLLERANDSTESPEEETQMCRHILDISAALASVYESDLKACAQSKQGDGKLSSEHSLQTCLHIQRLAARKASSLKDDIRKDRAFSLLTEAQRVLDLASCPELAVSVPARKEAYRHLTSSWHNCGAQLYGDKDPGSAVRFLKKAAECAELGVGLGISSDMSVSEADEKAHEADVEMLSKKWEHLAMCCRYTGQKREAEAYYVKAVLAVSERMWGSIAERAASMPIEDVFAADQAVEDKRTLREIATMVGALFELQAYELFSFSEAEEIKVGHHLFDQLQRARPTIPKEALSALREHCILSMTSTMHREGAPAAAMMLLNDQLRDLDVATFPIRRARALLRRMQLILLMPRLDEAGGILSLHAECQTALSSEVKSTADKNLAFSLPRLKAELSMLTVLMMQSQQLSASELDLSGAVDDLVRQLLELVGDQSSSKAATEASEKRPILRKTIAPRQTKQVLPPKTPLRQKPQLSPRKAATSANKSAACTLQQTQHTIKLDLSLLELVCETLVAHGANLLSIRLIEASVSVAASSVSESALSFRVKSLASLVLARLEYEQTFEAAAAFEQLGKTLEEQQDIELPRSILCRSALARASYHRISGDITRCRSILENEKAFLNQVDEAERPNTWHNVLERSERIELQVAATALEAALALDTGDLVTAVKESVTGIRLSLKAGATIAHLCSFKNASSAAEDPFSKPVSADSKEDASARTVPEGITSRRQQYSSLRLAAASRRVAMMTLDAYLATCRLYATRGSPRDAECLATEAVDFALKSPCDLNTCRVLLFRSQLRLDMGLIEQASADHVLAKSLANSTGEPIVAIYVLLVSADLACASEQFDEALKTLNAALDLVQGPWSEAKEQTNGRGAVRTNTSRRTDSRVFLPSLRDIVLQRIATLLHRMGRTDEGLSIINDADIAPNKHPSLRSVASVLSRLLLSQAWERMAREPRSALATEAVMLLPECVNVLSQTNGPRSSMLDLVHDDARRAIAHAVEHLNTFSGSRRRDVVDSIIHRNAQVLSAVAHISQCASQQCTSRLKAASLITSSLDASMSIALERELLDAIQAKCDRQALTPARCHKTTRGIQQARHHKSRNSARLLDSDEDDSNDEDESSDASNNTLTMWSQARSRRQAQTEPFDSEILPCGTRVLSLSFCHDRNSLIVTRRENGQTHPQVVVLPIDRSGRLDGDDEVIGAKHVLNELKEIVTESNTATHSAQHLDGLQARKEWWTQRRALDTRLKELLSCIENTWLGVFKGLLLPSRSAASEAREALSQTVSNIVSRACNADGAHKRKIDIGIDDVLIGSLASLQSSQVTDEELEDFVHYALDACQLQGISVAVDEVDLDLCTTDLRAAIEAFDARVATSAEGTAAVDETHTYLILDKDLQAIPWESLPSLRKHAFSRVPSTLFLQDRLAMLQGDTYTLSSTNSRKWYLLNPSEDLKRTQDRFSPYFQSQQANGSGKPTSRNGHCAAPQPWRGIAGRVPTMDEFATALKTNDLVVYFGHGGAEQYVRPSRLKSMKRCAVTMLWGCSSGVLRDMGIYDPTGTPYNYMLAGCPSLVANLWDATDKELDGVSESVLNLMGIIDTSSVGIPQTAAKKVLQPSKPSSSRPMSIAQAVAQSRDACKLPYLTGAACVVYGIPVYYDTSK